MFNSAEVRKQFPQVSFKPEGREIVYLDSAATALKPVAVIERMKEFYSHEIANVHRGAHYYSDKATSTYENARETVREFLNAKLTNEIVFTKGTTESLNLIASSYGRQFLNPGDEILLTYMEHHSNIVPWQMIAKERGLKIVAVPVTAEGEIRLEDFRKNISQRTKLVSMVHVSNALGTINPIAEMVRISREVGAITVVDAAQSVSTVKVDVQVLGCDFLAFSGHKLFGPNGVGVLYGRQELLNKMPPYQGGGSMISTVSFEGTNYLEAPQRFEAGTPPVAEAVGLAEAIRYFTSLGIENTKQHKKRLLALATERLKSIPGIRLVGEAEQKTAIVSFLLEGTHPSDIGQILDQQGVAVRVGHHCNQPLMTFFKIPGTVRASFTIYNNDADVDAFYKAVLKAKEILL